MIDLKLIDALKVRLAVLFPNEIATRIAEMTNAKFLCMIALVPVSIIISAVIVCQQEKTRPSQFRYSHQEELEACDVPVAPPLPDSEHDYSLPTETKFNEFMGVDFKKNIMDQSGFQKCGKCSKRSPCSMSSSGLWCCFDKSPHSALFDGVHVAVMGRDNLPVKAIYYSRTRHDSNSERAVISIIEKVLGRSCSMEENIYEYNGCKYYSFGPKQEWVFEIEGVSFEYCPDARNAVYVSSSGERLNYPQSIEAYLLIIHPQFIKLSDQELGL